MTTIGIIGAGNIGSNVAKAAIAKGYDVVISNSRGPETLGDLIDELGAKATPATAEGAAEAGDFVLVAVPLKNYREVPVEPLKGKLVIDANNYYFERDGQIPALDNGETTTALMLQEHLPESTVVKAFNNIPAKDIPSDGTPAGSEDRRALPVAGDDAEGKARVIALLDEFGFDGVDVGSLADSWRVERDRPAYVVRSNADELVMRVAEAVR
ncbi:NADPH-dependent F420 reductase [Demequina aurantiaca]|uniref:NADPH-dependent F420 reductase n=1 Tax=Demequina aurantiaca TaxID=676200 RepID=UPI003D326B7C